MTLLAGLTACTAAICRRHAASHETIARLALEVLALDVPATRLDATVTIARLRLTNEQNPKGFAVAPVGGF